MDADMFGECSSVSEEKQRRKNRIQIYKKILNFYRGKSLSLDCALGSKEPEPHVLPHVRNYQALSKHIQDLHDDITLVQVTRNCLDLVYDSLTSNELMGIDDINIKRKSLEKIQTIIFFSNSILKLYRENCNESELLRKKKEYSAILDEYSKIVERVKESDQKRDKEESEELVKAEPIIYKINLMRQMKAILLGYISVNCPKVFKDVVEYKTSYRKNLTVEDFRETWDVGLK